MGFNCGIIGLPNVGKSTIFNALASAKAPMSNYAFCTIEPNKGIVVVPDERLLEIGRLLGKKNPIPTKIEFVDVAGLVKDASKGEGLGNKFLGHIRTMDSLIHVVRCFHAEDVVHVMGDVDPLRDIGIVNTELILADLEVLERAKSKIVQKARSGEKEAQARLSLIDSMEEHLNAGRMLGQSDLAEPEVATAEELGLITQKAVLYVANVDEDNRQGDLNNSVEEYAQQEGAGHTYIVGSVEEEISELPLDEKREYLEAMDLTESGLDRIIEKSYRMLELITFYTVTTDLQAWTVRAGTQAPQAAGRIHSDFEAGFIRAETYHFNDLIELGSEGKLRAKGLIRVEGRDYVIEDGDIVHFLFNP